MWITRKQERKILRLAMSKIYAVQERGDLEPRLNDSEDFLDIAVWCLRDALHAVFEYGYMEGQMEAQNEQKQAGH